MALEGGVVGPGRLIGPVGLIEVGVLFAPAPLPPHLLLLPARLRLGDGHGDFDRLLAHAAESVHVNQRVPLLVLIREPLHT